MRKSFEIRKDLEEQRTICAGELEGEQRREAFEKLQSLVAELNEALLSEAAERAIANSAAMAPQAEEARRRFSMSKFIREAAENNLTGFEAEMRQEGAKEFKEQGIIAKGFALPSFLVRDFTVNNVSTVGEGKEFAHVTSMTYIESLRNALVMQRLGATYLSGLQGNLAFVTGAQAVANWLAEGASDTTQIIDYTSKTMTPHGLSITCGYTADLLHQSSLEVDALIMAEMSRAHASAVDAAAIAGTGTTGQPTGILSTEGIGVVALGVNGGALTFGSIVDLEGKVSDANALFGNLAYLTNSKVAASAKKSAKIDGYPAYILEDGKMNGYDVVVSNSVPSKLEKGNSGAVCSAALFGDFSNVIIGQWGGLDLIVDPYTNKKDRIVEVTAYAYHDVLVRRPQAFAAIKDILATL